MSAIDTLEDGRDKRLVAGFLEAIGQMVAHGTIEDPRAAMALGVDLFSYGMFLMLHRLSDPTDAPRLQERVQNMTTAVNAQLAQMVEHYARDHAVLTDVTETPDETFAALEAQYGKLKVM